MRRILPIAMFLLCSPPAAAIPADVAIGFSDQHTAESKVATAVGSAKSKIRVAIFSLNEPGIVQALTAARGRGVDVRVKYDVSQAAQPIMATALGTLDHAGVFCFPIAMPGRSYMHHKFAVIDGVVTVTGSFNWTRNATLHNWENLVVITSSDVADAYESEWERIKPYTPKSSRP